MAIEEYRRKRDFQKTPEPEPRKARGGGNRFVVHRHEARNLHYDLRIEAGSALACWAVPKGFSYTPADKRLAVRTEDHPLEYEAFEGTIPKGQYGAGTMKIWDSGTYEVRKAQDIAHALDKGELKLDLKGRRLRGEWHMVRTRQEEGRNWLLFKAKDRYAGSGSDLFGGADMGRALQKPLARSFARMEASTGVAAIQRPGVALRACVHRKARPCASGGVRDCAPGKVGRPHREAPRHLQGAGQRARRDGGVRWHCRGP